MAADTTKRLRFDAEPHHTLVYDDERAAVHGGEEFDVDTATFERLMAAPYVRVSDTTPPEPAARPRARGASDKTKEE